MKQIPIMKPYFDEVEINEIKKVLDTGWVAQGPKVAEFEGIVAKHEGVQHAIATTSCTTALHLSLVAMGAGPTHDIIVPSYTFVATANAVEYTGATAVLVEVDRSTYNIDLTWTENYIKDHYTTKDNKLVNNETGKELFGIVPVSLFGLCADMPAVKKLAQKLNIRILEDNACALGATIDGTHEGAFGNPACLSFHPRKSITTGEGGMILTNDEDLAKKARELRSHAASLSEVARHESKGYLLPEFNDLGFNYRMTDIQAAMGVAQMGKFDKMLETKQKKAENYNNLLKNVPELIVPAVPVGYGHTYQSYVCMLDNEKMGLSVDDANLFRNRAMDFLETNGIATRQGTHAVHTLGFYKKKYGYKPQDLPVAYACDRLSLAIPFYFEMSDDDQEYVVEMLQKAFKVAANS